MLDWVTNTLFRAFPAEFDSRYPLAESVNLLQAAVNNANAYGEVAAKDVSISRYGPGSWNLFVLYFMGEFRMRQGRVFLVGAFSFSTMAKFATALWLIGFAALTVVCSVLAWLHMEPSLIVLPPVALFLTGLLALWLARTSVTGEMSELSRLIQRTLS